MPKSKRSKLVTLSKVKKRKTKDWKRELVSVVRKNVDEYPNIFVLHYENMRNDKFKELRENLKGSSRFFWGAGKIAGVALGRSKSEEYQEGLSQVANSLHGERGLLFTHLSKEEVVKLFDQWESLDYARAGAKATEDFELSAGRLDGPNGPLPHTMEPLLRGHKLPVKLQRGEVHLIADHTVSKIGQTLTPDQAAILKAFDVKMALFKFQPVAFWQKEGGVFEQLIEDAEKEFASGSEDGGDEFGGVDVPGLPEGMI